MKKPSPLFLNRELSLLKFNERVLSLSRDKRLPLLEKLNFLDIFYSNMDEFFMKRVGSLKRYEASHFAPPLIDDTTATYQLNLIRKEVLRMNKEASSIFNKDLLPGMKKEGMKLLKMEELSKKQKAYVQDIFDNQIFPVLIPVSVDKSHPFPLISSLSISLALKLVKKKKATFARVKVPSFFQGWLPLPQEKEGEFSFVSSLDLISKNLQSPFPEKHVESFMSFRITRNIDLDSEFDEEEDAEDLLEFVEEELAQRRFADIVRLQHEKDPDPWLLSFLKDELKLNDMDMYEMDKSLDYFSLKPFVALDLPHLKHPRKKPVVPKWAKKDLFEMIKKKDRLVHQPYESYSSTVESFVLKSASDPKVVAIKMTLYRTNENSNIVQALMLAARSGKQVVCILELKARLDEQKNIKWAHKMEKAGVHVVYGILGLKTHAKACLVVRKEDEGFQSYLHIGTGNYHAGNARLYTDFSFFTCEKEICKEATFFFHFLTGSSQKKDYKKLVPSPFLMEKTLLSLIEKEIEHAKKGLPSEIRIKVNNLEAPKIIKALYKASQEGVSIKLLVRGICCLRPGIKGLSENIKVKSIVGPLLEHSRIFYFRSGKKEAIDGFFFIGSADCMKRNLYYRIELLSPILRKQSRKRILGLLERMWEDKSSSFILDQKGNYLDPDRSLPFFHDKLSESYHRNKEPL